MKFLSFYMLTPGQRGVLNNSGSKCASSGHLLCRRNALLLLSIPHRPLCKDFSGGWPSDVHYLMSIQVMVPTVAVMKTAVLLDKDADPAST